MTTPLTPAITVGRIKFVYFLLTGLRWFAVALPLALVYGFMGERGLDLFQIGVLGALYAATIVVLELPTGGLADAVGRKRVTLVAGAVSLLAGAAMLLAFSFWGFVVAWLLMGVARALNSGALDAWYIDGLLAADPEVELQPALAQSASVQIAALALGTLAGGFLPALFTDLPPDSGALLGPLATTLLASLAVQALALLLTALLVVESRPAAAERLAGGLRRVPRLMREALGQSRRNPTIVLLLAAGALGSAALASVETFWQPHFGRWLDPNGASTLFGLLMTGAFVLGLIGNLLATPLGRMLRGRYGLAAAASSLLSGLAVIGLALQTAPLSAAWPFLLFYFGNGLGNSPAGALLNTEIPAERRSAMLSVASLAGYLGAALATPLFGLLAERSGVGGVWLIAGALSLVATALFVFIDRRRPAPDGSGRRRHRRPAPTPAAVE